ncbi:MAG TPA: hypothetical protein PKE45_15550 [Caldilineaceae bacterium]|nr:hypothetical protein [Caldilineaceae bacterium]
MTAAKKKRIGIYLTPQVILSNPGYLEVLRDQLGLNLLVLVWNGELPPEVLAQSPYDGAPPSPERVRTLIARHLDGQPSTAKFASAEKSVGPHVSAGGNDQEVRAAIAVAKGVGLEIWLMGGMYTASDYDVLMYCPSKEENNRWYEAVYTYLATSYGADGLDITHARYPMTSYPRGLFLCMCDDCARSAAALGYDMAAMQADIRQAWARLRALPAGRLTAVGQHDMGLSDYLQLLGLRTGLVDWFNFRTALLARNVQRFRKAVHGAAGEHFIFGTDTYPASLALFVGHNLSRWSEFSDFASPLLSHVDIFPMQTLTEAAQFVRRLYPAVSETEALRLVYRFTGYDGLKLPDSIADFALGEPDCEFRNIPLRDFVALDMAKARLFLPDDIPSYPIIQGGGAPWLWPREIVEAVMSAAFEHGHDGYIFQGTKSLVDFELK